MNYILEDILKDAALEVFEAVAFMFPITQEETFLYRRSGKTGFQDEDDLKQTVASMDFSGPCNGTLVLCLDPGVQKDLATSVLGLDDNLGGPSAQQQEDSLKELLNVFCGRLLPRIVGLEAVFDLQPAQLIPEGKMPDFMLGRPALAQAGLTLDTGKAQTRLFMAESGLLPEITRPNLECSACLPEDWTECPEKILVFHPLDDIRNSLKTMLAGQNYDFFEAGDFQNAVRITRDNSLDLILIDAKAFVAHANEWFTELQCDPEFCQFPIIAVVSSDGGQDSVAALNSGARDCLEWPCNHALARARLRTALKLNKADTQLRELSGELASKNRKLVELNKTSERFVADVSHDFRSPLCVIKEFSSIISDGLGGPVSQDQIEYLEFITKAANDLAQMVDDLLDTSRLRAGTLRVDRRCCTINSIIGPVRTMLQSSADLKNITIEEKISPDVTEVFADSEKTRRILTNLCSNAIKYSSNGTNVILWAKNSGNAVEVGVTDSGPGMPEQELHAVFQRFRRGANLGKNDAKGFGLGLNIASQLVCLSLSELHGRSNLGVGSTFWFDLPKFNWEAIVSKFAMLFEGVSEQTSIGVLEVKLTHPDDSLERVFEFLTAQCRPMDVILGDLQGNNLLLLGSVEKPEQWAQRLDEAKKEAMSATSLVKYPETHTRVLGTWPCPTESAAMQNVVLNHLNGRYHLVT